MAHFSPTYKFSPDQVLVGSFGSMSEHDQIIRSFQQTNMLSEQNIGDLIKNSEIQLKEKIKNDRLLAGNQLNALKEIGRQNDILNNSVNNLYNELNNFTSRMDLFHSALMEQYAISNASLNDIAEFSKMPEFEKERLFLIKNGLKFLKEIFVNAERYQDSLDYFIKANELNNKDYIVLKQIGLIYLYGEDCIDIIKAIEYLTKALSYAESAGKTNEISSISNHLAYACLLALDFDKTIKYADKSLAIENNTKLKYIKSEALMLNGNVYESIDLLKEILHEDFAYISDITNNKNFNGPELEYFLESQKQKLESMIDKVTFKIEEKLTDKSNLEPNFIEINSRISKSNVTLEELYNAYLDFTKLLVKIEAEYDVFHGFTSEVLKRLNSNKNNLSDIQFLAVRENCYEDAEMADEMLSRFLSSNRDKKLKREHDLAIENKFKIIFNTGFVMNASTIFIGLVCGWMMFYHHIQSGVHFGYSIITMIVCLVVHRVIKNYFLFKNRVPTYLFGWSIGMVILLKIYFDTFGF